MKTCRRGGSDSRIARKRASRGAVAGAGDARVCEGETERSWHEDTRERGESDRVSKLEAVAVTNRFAVLWMTRATWNCLGDICELARADSLSDEVIVSGHWFKRWNGGSDWSGESDWNGGNDWINLYIRDECWSSRRNDAGLACGHEQIQRVELAIAAQRRGAVEHPRSEEREECASPEIRRTRSVCSQVGETERVSQQEYSTSTSYGPKLF